MLWCRALVEQYKDVLDEDTAERFLLAYPSKHKGYAALTEAVVSMGLLGEWVHTQGQQLLTFST